MKKFGVIILAFLLVLTVTACDLNPIVNKLNGNKAAAEEKAEKEKYTVLEDGSYLYKQSAVSGNNKIQFKDEADNILLDSSEIKFVSAKWSEFNGYYIQLEFTEDGTVDFANATKENLGKKIHIVSGEKILSSPTVYEEITDGVVVIANVENFDLLISFFNELVEE